MTTIDCAIFRRYKLKRGKQDEIDTMSHDSLPIGEKKPILIITKMNRAPSEKILKNQLLLNVFASYFATVLIL